MTRFVLHGGHTSEKCESNKKFFKSILEGLENPKILLVYFAKEEGTWDELYERDKKNFNFKCEFLIANKKDFSEQLKNTDIVYLRGGDTDLLMKELMKVDFKNLIKGKVVAGSSAGAYVLVKYFYSNDKDELKKGLGILNIKVFCHYSEDNKGKLEMLKEYKEDLKLYVLKDCEFVVLDEIFYFYDLKNKNSC